MTVDAIRVWPEGRDGVWIPNLADLTAWLAMSDEPIHCFLPTPIAAVGADWDRDKVIAAVESAERVALLTGEAIRGNLGHSLAVIGGNKLLMFDIGDMDALIVEVASPATSTLATPSPPDSKPVSGSTTGVQS